ncbi:MAG TPA: gluconolactonase, partial [Porphyromonadaceae bacterium]|nr:gluconolactonase [Porphyromonadaceae bacterium]
MKVVTGLVLLICCSSVYGQKNSIISKNAKIEKVGTGYSFTEGPAVSGEGRVYFTDQPNDRIYVWDEGKGISLWAEETGRSNGLYVDADGQLVSCADLHNQIVRFGKDKKMQVVYEKYDGKQLNGPNDLWITPKGGIYFT